MISNNFGGVSCQEANIADAVFLPIAATQAFEAGAFVRLDAAGRVVVTPVDATGYYVKVTTGEFTKIYGIAMVSSYVDNKSAAYGATVVALAVGVLIPVWKIDVKSELVLQVAENTDGPPPLFTGGGTLTMATTSYARALVGANVLSGANPPAGGGVCIGSGIDPTTGVVARFVVGDVAPTTNGIFRIDRLLDPLYATDTHTLGRVAGTIYDVFIQ